MLQAPTGQPSRFTDIRRKYNETKENCKRVGGKRESANLLEVAAGSKGDGGFIAEYIGKADNRGPEGDCRERGKEPGMEPTLRKIGGGGAYIAVGASSEGDI